MISLDDISDLEWALGFGLTKFQKSTSGILLERAMRYCFDSEGKRIPRVEDTWKVMPVAKTDTGLTYTPDFRDLHRFGRVSRILLVGERTDTLLVTAIKLFYGDAGARWGRETIGRDACLFPLTRTGRGLLKLLREQSGFELRDDELLVNDYYSPQHQQGSHRKHLHIKMRDEADDMKVRFWKGWKAWKQEQRAKVAG
jgi:hypothetical protein